MHPNHSINLNPEWELAERPSGRGSPEGTGWEPYSSYSTEGGSVYICWRRRIAPAQPPAQSTPKPEPLTPPVSVYKIEVMVIDHDDVGAQRVVDGINNLNNHQVMGIAAQSIRWFSSHPINQRATVGREFDKLFKKP